MSAPLIGITTRNYSGIIHDIPWILTPRSYTESVINSGAIPVLLPLNLPQGNVIELLKKLDGVIFSGGGDIDIRNFGGEEHEKIYGVDVERDETELFLMEKVVEQKIPFLSICRGLQVMNVCFGGTLYTHILDQKESALDHSFNKEFDFNYKSHSVHLVEGSKLRSIIGKSDIGVNSLHHQGIQYASADLKITAVSTDNLVEGLELEDHPFGIGVQWHPEWMPEDEDQQKLFSALKEAAQKRAEKNGR
jgi:putative glutamine amidotransferase